FLLLLVCCDADRRGLFSFPTRRSSDLHRRCLRRGHASHTQTSTGGTPAHERGGISRRATVANRHPLFRNPAWRDADRCTLSSSRDRKSTRLNSSHVAISYAVFCLKKKR